MIKISPSIISADFRKLEEEILSVVESGADMLHCDIMDGHFVPNITIGPDIVRTIHEIVPDIPLDVHLMITHPHKYIERFIKSGASYILFHIESECDVANTIEMIKENGCRPGLVINPDTPIDTIFPYIDRLGMVLLMSVYPGFSGQKMIEKVLDKVPKLVEEREKRNLDFLIEMDGGIKPDNASKVREVGVDVIVSASAIFGSNDYKKVIDELRGTK